MKRVLFAVTLLVALGVTSVALAARPFGAYTAKKGGATYTLEFSGSSYTFLTDGHKIVTGHDTVSGSKITFVDNPGANSCPKAGVYTYAQHGRNLTFHKVSDTCDRSTFITLHWTLLGQG